MLRRLKLRVCEGASFAASAANEHDLLNEDDLFSPGKTVRVRPAVEGRLELLREDSPQLRSPEQTRALVDAEELGRVDAADELGRVEPAEELGRVEPAAELGRVEVRLEERLHEFAVLCKASAKSKSN